MNPKISIITPSYNQGQFLEKTIQSILNQNYPNLEYIIIDGGSKDNSVDIIKKYQDRLSYWISEKDKGTYEANNKGLAKLTGDYWCVVNSDDLLLPGSIQTIADAIQEHPNEKWFAGGVYNIDEKDGVIGESWLPIPPGQNALNISFLSGCWIPHPAVFLHKSLISIVGNFNSFHSMDYDYWLRLEYAGFKPFCINKELASLRLHADCKSADAFKLQEEILKVYLNFCTEKNLLKHKFARKRGDELELNILKIKLNLNLIDNKKLESIATLMKIFKLEPRLIFKQWTIGALKRIVFGMSPNDPIHNLYNKNSQANWS